MARPFIIEPSNTLVTQENATKSLVWVIESCGWEVRIVTENYTLYPNIDPERVPIKPNTDYNVSVTPEVHLCEDSAMNTNVSLSINFNSNVLRYVEYLICKVYSTYDVRYRSRVNFKVLAAPPLADTITIAGTTERMMTNNSVTELSMPIEMKDNVTTDSGYRHSLHFGAVLINFASLFLYHLFVESL